MKFIKVIVGGKNKLIYNDPDASLEIEPNLNFVFNGNDQIDRDLQEWMYRFYQSDLFLSETKQGAIQNSIVCVELSITQILENIDKRSCLWNYYKQLQQELAELKDWLNQ